MKKTSFIVAATALSLVGFMSCSKSNSSDPSGSGSKTASADSNKVELTSNTKFGQIITDGNGNTLYFFSIDASGNSGCIGNCTAAWPVYYATNLNVQTGLNSSDFATITRPDGKKQTTYKGWPLYYYIGDTKAGDVNGDGSGNLWFVAKADYTVMLASQQLVGADGNNYISNYTVGTGTTAYITDAAGKTLYAFSPDKYQQNTYTKSDFSNNTVWPIDSVSTIGSIPSILNKSDFSIITVFTKTQLAYKGWPLYYFGPDNNTRGNTKGVSVPKPGIWPITNTQTQTAPKS